MKNLYHILIFLFISAPNLKAQTYDVSGVVKNGGNISIPYANVFLLSIKDSSIVKGASANDDGVFNITDVSPAIYWLSTSYVGQSSKYRAIDVQKNIKVGTLIIEESVSDLDEVVVYANKPTIERKVDRVVFNVENTVISQSNTWDILKKSPGVIVIQDDLQIRGQSATIYINERKVQLSQSEVSDLLGGMSGTDIKSIEVLSNPSAKYDAEGGPIINIVTGKNIIPGYKGSFQGNYKQGIFPKYSFGTSHYFKTEKLSVFANYTINPKKLKRNIYSTINYLDNVNNIYSIWDTNYGKTERSLGHVGSLVLDYQLDDNNSFNLTTNAVLQPKKDYNTILTGTISNGLGQLDSTITNRSKAFENSHNIGVDFTYKHNLKKEGATINFNVHYTNFLKDKNQDAASIYEDVTGNFLRGFSFYTQINQNIDIVTGQIDYSSPLASANIEMGGKISNIQSQSGMDYFNVLGTSRLLNSNLSDDFEYKETVLAAYVNFMRDWKKWNIQLGLRGENTNATGISNVLNQTNNQNYFELFPSAYVLFTPSDDHNILFNYNRKLYRPRYRDLNPFKTYLNENDFTTGNPNLQPSFAHNFKLGYTLKRDYYFELYYTDNGHSINLFSFQDNENQTISGVQRNMLSSVYYGVDFSISKSILNSWSIYSYMSLYYMDKEFNVPDTGNSTHKNVIEGFYFNLTNYVTLSKDRTFTAELDLLYATDYLIGNYINDETANLSFGLRKTLWKNRASLSLFVNDILKRKRQTYYSVFLNQNNTYKPRSEYQYIRLGFKYNFGNFRLDDNNRRIRKKERDRL